MALPNWASLGAECELDTTNVVKLGEGWSCVAYLVDAQYVFKLAKKPEGAAELVKEATILSFLEKKLPSNIPTNYQIFPESDVWLNGYSVQSFIDGMPLSKAPTNLDMIADRIGETLRVLHSLPKAGLNDLTNPSFRNKPRSFLDKALHHIQQRYGEATRQKIDAASRSFMDTVEYFEFEPRLIHGDLHGDHIIKMNNKEIGVIDWGDVVLGDPDRDFLLLYQRMDDRFVSRCAKAYGHTDLSSLFLKLKGLDLLSELHDVVYAGTLGLPSEEDDAFEAVKRWADRNT